MPPANRLPGSETILVVDDDPSVLSITSALLTRRGYNVLQATSGPQALEICAGRESSVQLLLTDVIMPMMTGPELAERVLALCPDTRVLFMSGYQDYQFEKYRPFSFKCFMRKPFTPEILIATVRQALDQPRELGPGSKLSAADIRKASG